VKRPRLLYLASSFPYGKNDTFFACEVRELVRQGVDVQAIPVRPRGDLTTADAGMLAVRRPLLDLGILAAALAESVRSPRAVGRALALLLRQPSPNVLVRNLSAFPKALWIARVARRTRADHIHAPWAGPPATTAMVASIVSGVPWSFTGHFADIAANNLLREKCRSAVFVRFIAKAMMELARRTEPAADESRWVLVHSGIDVPASWSPADRLNRPPVVLMSARFDPEKRHETLVRAAGELAKDGRALEVWLAGTGQLEQAVADQVREQDLGRIVKLLGYVPNEQILAWLDAHRVDLVVLPSDAEGIPYSLIEALAHGVPAVASAAGGIEELLGDGCGELVQPGDARGVAVAIGRLLDSPELRLRYAMSGRERVEREFSAEAAARTLRELFGFVAPSGAVEPAPDSDPG
jgi:colanic acid/amylovoran biosynthesis glycosyltransferase